MATTRWWMGDDVTARDEPVFALTTRGLEGVVANELSPIAGVTIIERGYRRVSLLTSGSLGALLTLRTADDVFLQLASWDNVSHTRAALNDLRDRSRRFDLERAAIAIGRVRPIPDVPAFTVTSSFVGRRNYTNSEIEAAFVASVAGATGWRFDTEDRSADLHLRIFAEHERAWLGVRIARSPLHERTYPRLHRPGALRPSIAAAMVALADVTPGGTILDPFCGTGTILVEAANMHHPVIGGDLSDEAVAVARHNLRAASLAGAIAQWDATSLPLASRSMDGVVTNPPWGRQVAVTESLKTLYDEAVREAIRVVVPGSPIVLLTAYPELVESLGVGSWERHEISLYGQTPTILVST